MKINNKASLCDPEVDKLPDIPPDKLSSIEKLLQQNCSALSSVASGKVACSDSSDKGKSREQALCPVTKAKHICNKGRRFKFLKQ